MMLEHVHEYDKAKQLRRTIKVVLNEDNVRTGDLGGSATTSEYAEAIIKRLT